MNRGTFAILVEYAALVAFIGFIVLRTWYRDRAVVRERAVLKATRRIMDALDVCDPEVDAHL